MASHRRPVDHGGREPVDSSRKGADIDTALAARAWNRAGAARWNVPIEVFTAALRRSVRHAFSSQQPSPREVERYVEGLHLEDLALATACEAGLDAAWNHFILEYRPALYRAAGAIDGPGGGRELADSLYGDLFGLRERNGERQSLFRYFHGRSSLGSWVRAVLAQRHVDRIRATRRLVPLPEEHGPRALVSTPGGEDPDHRRHHAALHAALEVALAVLAPRDRLRLRCYYAQNMKLAAIGRLLGEHEASASRHLSRTRRELRQSIEEHLRKVGGYDEGALAACFRSVVDDSGSLDLGTMLAAGGVGKDPAPDRSWGR